MKTFKEFIDEQLDEDDVDYEKKKKALALQAAQERMKKDAAGVQRSANEINAFKSKHKLKRAELQKKYFENLQDFNKVDSHLKSSEIIKEKWKSAMDKGHKLMLDWSYGSPYTLVSYMMREKLLSKDDIFKIMSPIKHLIKDYDPLTFFKEMGEGF